MLQAGVRHAGIAEVQLLELRQALEVLQAGIRDLGAAKAQLLELRQTLDVLQTGVRDWAAAEVQLPEMCQAFEVLQVSVGHSNAREVNSYRRPTLSVNLDPAPKLLDFGDSRFLAGTATAKRES